MKPISALMVVAATLTFALGPNSALAQAGKPGVERLYILDLGQDGASMQHMADIMSQQKAQLWINHDKVQADTLKHAPEYYE